MRKPPAQIAEPLPVLPPMPGWIGSAPAETPESVAFRSGAALAHLGLAVQSAPVPLALWRDRLALAAAEVCAALDGRREDGRALRDAVLLTRPGDDPGPAGRILRQWSRAAAGPITGAALARAIEGGTAEQVALCLDAIGPTPVDRAAWVIEAVLTESPRRQTAALILADAVLSRSLGQGHVLPLISLAVKPRDLRLRGDDLRLACHRAAALGAGRALPLAADLARAAARLHAVAPKLRARGAARARDLFLSRDALAPTALDFMSDRAARRLCDRLVALGVLRELTGRETFRLYGL